MEISYVGNLSACLIPLAAVSGLVVMWLLFWWLARDLDTGGGSYIREGWWTPEADRPTLAVAEEYQPYNAYKQGGSWLHWAEPVATTTTTQPAPPPQQSPRWPKRSAKPAPQPTAMSQSIYRQVPTPSKVQRVSGLGVNVRAIEKNTRAVCILHGVPRSQCGCT